MRIFVTGATGFIGSLVVPDLLAAGHQVVGLTRSDSGAAALTAAGAEAYRGTLEDPATLRKGAETADAVIHLAFDHNFANFLANCEKDSRNIAAMGEALAGSDRPLLITSGTGMGTPHEGGVAVESVLNLDHPNPRSMTEIAGNALLDKGINVSVMRLPQVHDTEKQGLITPLIEIFKAKGACAYVGEGQNRWPAGARADVAHLYRLAIERGVAGARYHAVGEEGITAREIAETLARGLNLPVHAVAPDKVADSFSWMGMFAALDMAASSAWTRETLGWNPTGPTLIADLEAMQY